MMIQLPSLEVFFNACLIATLFTLTIRFMTPSLFDGEEEESSEKVEASKNSMANPLQGIKNDVGVSPLFSADKNTTMEKMGNLEQINFQIPKATMKEIIEMSPDRDAKKGLEEAYHLWIYIQRQKKLGLELGLFNRPDGSIHLIDTKKPNLVLQGISQDIGPEIDPKKAA